MMESIVNSDNRPEIKVFRSIDEMASAFFKLLTEEISLAQSEGRNCHVALSGGSTPVKIFEKLSGLNPGKLKFDHLHLYWGDERCVPPDSPESNYGNAWNSLIRYLEMPAQNIHRIIGEADPVSECLRYENLLKSSLLIKNGIPCFDLIFLGMGEDGHTASIFTGQMENLDSDSLCVVARHPVTGQQRISLTGKVINNAKKVLFLVTGNSKAGLVKTIINREKGCEIYPAAHINPVHGKLLWFLDKDAGRFVKDLSDFKS